MGPPKVKQVRRLRDRKNNRASTVFQSLTDPDAELGNWVMRRAKTRKHAETDLKRWTPSPRWSPSFSTTFVYQSLFNVIAETKD